jgi:UDP-N-acetylglucosamine diphosphorylase/glucosamine-1-phosphate N-acetyltransferase
MHRLIIFDDGLGRLGPMTDLRASFEVRTGMHLTCHRIALAWPKALGGYWVQPRLLDLVRERANAPVNVLPNDEALLLVNGRWAMPDPSHRPDVGEALIEESTGHVVMAHLRRADTEYFLRTLEGGAGGQLSERVRSEPMAGGRVLYRWPWDVIAMSRQTIAHDILATRLPNATLVTGVAALVGDHPIEIHPSAKIYPNVTLDSEGGPIMIHERAVIRPGAVLIGPCSIGPDSTVIDRALIKANTVIGPHCKVAGEVGATIFQGFSNKAHDGHLGDSWVGKWANFGAGTVNSNLLNTYGEVTMRLDPDSPRQRTGLQFLGAIVGDHVKFAICSRIMTGSVIGTGAMIATTAAVPTTVRRFAWLTDEGERSFRLDKFLDIAKTVMARRHVTPSDAYVKAVSGLHANMTQEAAAATR